MANNFDEVNFSPSGGSFMICDFVTENLKNYCRTFDCMILTGNIFNGN